MTGIQEINHLWIILINCTVTYKVWLKKGQFLLNIISRDPGVLNIRPFTHEKDMHALK